MSYRVEYNPEKNKLYPIKSVSKSKWILVALAVMISVFLVQKLDQRHTVRNLLLPGDPEVTAGAISNMVSQIREGEPVVEALNGFCLEILENG